MLNFTEKDCLYAYVVQTAESYDGRGPRRIVRIVDCYAPGTIAAAVWSGHHCAREPFAEITDEVPFKLERVELADG